MDLCAADLEAAGAGTEELEVTDLGAERSAGREDAESMPLKVAPGSLKDPLEAVSLLSVPPQPRQPRTFWK